MTVVFSLLLAAPLSPIVTAGDEISSMLFSAEEPHESSSGSGISRLRFLAIGDWGGQNNPPYYTKGQWETAKGMAKVAAGHTSGALNDDVDNTSRPAASFIIALGDNFYNGGLSDNEEQAQIRFEETFDKVYNHPNLQVPWYVLAGNHDHCGDISQQLKLSETNHRWNFPGLNYRIVQELIINEHSPAVKIEILIIDTVQLAGNLHCPSEDEDDNLLDEEFFESPTPPELTNDEESINQAQATLEWIEAALEKSDADYILVAGHYGIYSPCSHGNNPHLVKTLDPLLIKYGVTAYLSGHDHCQFHFANEDMNYVLSGAGAYCCYGSKKAMKLPTGGDLKFLHADTYDYSGTSKFIHNKEDDGDDYSGIIDGGFLSFDVGHDSMLLTFHRENGNTLHESRLLPRDSRFKMRIHENVVVQVERQ